MSIKKLQIFIPGILIAATGVGAGDLITAGLAGKHVGMALLLVPLLGAFLKAVLTEGIARWQLATNTTLLHGWITQLPKIFGYFFSLYFLLWSFFVGGALVNACGVAGHALFPLSENYLFSKSIWGVAHSLIGLVFILVGGFKYFEKLMSVIVAMMFASVLITAGFLIPSTDFSTTFHFSSIFEQMKWTLGVLGGVGGTLTVLSYGYWIKEKNRQGLQGLKESRLDLAVAYFLTGIFSMAMVIIGQQLSQITLTKGNFPIEVAAVLVNIIGTHGKYIFLIGFWGGVFSSLLGVWQGVPYIFSDAINIFKKEEKPNLENTNTYKGYLIALALIPLTTLMIKLEKIQILYAVTGAFFMPVLALVLLILNNRLKSKYKNTILSNICLIITLGLFSYLGIIKILKI